MISTFSFFFSFVLFFFFLLFNLFNLTTLKKKNRDLQQKKKKMEEIRDNTYDIDSFCIFSGNFRCLLGLSQSFSVPSVACILWKETSFILPTKKSKQ